MLTSLNRLKATKERFISENGRPEEQRTITFTFHVLHRNSIVASWHSSGNTTYQNFKQIFENFLRVNRVILIQVGFSSSFAVKRDTINVQGRRKTLR